jgi:hypothetical protein
MSILPRTTALVATMLTVALVTTAVLLCPRALADADPASDVLIGASVFYPYGPLVSADLRKTLDAQTQAARRAGFPIKVALIASPPDLGALTTLFGKPQQYATFLDQEFGFLSNPHPPLLVVMPDGYGVAGLPPASTASARSLPRPASGRVDDLARAAILAVRRLAAADGHALPRISVASGGGGGGAGSVLIIAAVALAAIGGAAAVIAIRVSRAGRTR